ncbi:MAG: calcium-translocating P-type ATPase, PMCA-type [Planctomycetaceae bacterium]|jgi:Ca2+-transporting ATPase|nr:calcium-translocating P-type ATPase, PMCA-type [Planctomycetaceae bacterium]
MSQTSITLNNAVIDLRQGLNEEQVKQSVEKYGRNTLTPPMRDAWWKLLLEKFEDPTIRILMLAAVASIAITVLEKFLLHRQDASFIDSIGILFAVALATLAGFFSEMKSAKEFELLNKVKDDIRVKTLRDGQMSEVSINDVVVGDVVSLHLGDKVPADGAMLDSLGLLVDQSVMTGESVPVEKHPPHDFSAFFSDNFYDSLQNADDQHCVYRGTMISDGRGQFLVTHVGDKTRLGQIAANLGSAKSDADTPLAQKLSKLAKQISLVGMISAAVIFVAMAFFAFWNWTPDWTLAGFVPLLKGILTAFIVAVTIIVVAVPEGLPMMVTVSLALNMMKMARENCLIRKLIASETIGSATVICSDKTGTLTQNRMTATWIFADMKEISGGDFDAIKQLPEWETLVDLISANSEASLHIESGKIQDVGNPTECSLLRLLYHAGIDYQRRRNKTPRLWELSHNSQRKMSLVAVEKTVEQDGKQIRETTVYAKGAPERLLQCCSHVIADGKREPMDSYRAAIETALTNAQNRALRVIAFAMKEGDGESFQEENAERFADYCDNTLYALIGIADPIRPEVVQAVETCREAGVNVKMITGDAKTTAVAIAKEAGILSGNYQPANLETQVQNGQVVLTSEEFAALDDEKLAGVIPHLRVLARSTPMDKLRLVKAMHHQGEVVAMTGDGTNDAPALKFADVGISMGMTGTEVAKEASDIVLLDDNFKSIVTGIWWGRTLYQNIQKFLQFQLSVNFAALTCALFGPFIGVPLPLTVSQLLWINIIMDTFAALALSADPPRSGSMKRKPIARNASIITRSMGLTILSNGVYQVIILFSALFFGWFLDSERRFQFHIDLRASENIEPLTVFFTIFVMFQFWNIFNSRSLRYEESPFSLLHKNRLFLTVIGIIAVVQIGMVQASDYLGIGMIFRTNPLSIRQWLGVAALTATIIPVGWLIRFLAYKIECRRTFTKTRDALTSK